MLFAVYCRVEVRPRGAFIDKQLVEAPSRSEARAQAVLGCIADFNVGLHDVDVRLISEIHETED